MSSTLWKGGCWPRVPCGRRWQGRASDDDEDDDDDYDDDDDGDDDY